MVFSQIFNEKLIQVLYSHEQQAWKIADFGLAAQGTSKIARTTTYSRGTPSYRAPETILNAKFTNKVDIFATGCILFEVVFLQKAFPHGDWQVCEYAKSHTKLPIPEKADTIIDWRRKEFVNAMLLNMLQIDSTGRPSASEIHGKFAGLGAHSVGVLQTSQSDDETSNARINSRENGATDENGNNLIQNRKVNQKAQGQTDSAPLWSINATKPRQLNLSLLHEFQTLDYILVVKFSKDCSCIAVGCPQNIQVFQWKIDAKITTFWAADAGLTISQYTNYFVAACFTRDNARLVTAGEIDEILIWNILQKQFEKRLVGHADAVCSLDISSDGDWLASGSQDHTVRLWDIETGTSLRIVEFRDSISRVCFSQDAGLVAVGMESGATHVLAGKTLSQLGALEEHLSHISALAFAPSSSELVSASWDKTLRLWRIGGEGGARGPESDSLLFNVCKARLTGHLDFVMSASWSPDGKWIASACMDNTVQFWDPLDGSRYPTLSFQVTGLLQEEKTLMVVARTIEFAPSTTCRVFAVSTDDKTLRIWSY